MPEPISGKPPPPPEEDKKEVKKLFNVDSYPDPFPGMEMTEDQKQQFWNTLTMFISRRIKHEMDKMKESLRKMKEM